MLRDERVQDGRSDAVATVQRFGWALNLNVHAHALVLDGVFARPADTVRSGLASTSFSITASWRRAQRSGRSWSTSGPRATPTARRNRTRPPMTLRTRRAVATDATICGRS
ncbi:MAG: hypothetical protein CL482_08580 [Acidobacteria bacterium]|nr:hypothetical protein [Acidobacteriota bacterium]